MTLSPMVVPELPKIDGFSYRSLQGEADAEALYAVHTGRLSRDGVDLSLHNEDMPSLAGLRRWLGQVIANGEADQWLVAQVHGQVVGYCQLESWHEEDGMWVYFIGGGVLPEWRRRGIGTAMLHWAEELARALARAEHPGERFEFAANASSTEHDTAALLRKAGYYVAFTTLEMGFDISMPLPADPPLPPGIELRPVLPEHIPLIIDSIIECYHNAFPGNRFRTTFDRRAYYTAEFRKPKYDPQLWYIAWDSAQVAGQVMLVRENGEVCVSQVSIRPAWRRLGLARALLVRALNDIRARGEQVIWLDTYAEYQGRAVDLYHSLGFRVLKEFGRYRKPALK